MRIYMVLLLLCLSSISNAQLVTIPDPVFRNILIQQFPSCFSANQQLDTTCSQVINAVTITAYGGISNLTGIQYFDNLDTLRISQNAITTFPDLPASLRYLHAYDCQLYSLPSLPASLKALYCTYNYVNTLPPLPSGLEVLNITGNAFSTLPPLPNSLKLLDCSNNQITQLPTPLPPSLTYLDCADNLITALPPLPNTLISLDCSRNLINALPTLPNSILSLACSDNLLTIIPTLPINLTSLDCADNFLTSLPALPNTIWSLYTPYNQLTTLPALPEMLYTLRCDNNQLSTLPKFPPYLTFIYCNDNHLVKVPSFNDQVFVLDIANNPLLDCIPILPKSLFYLNTAGTLINCLPNNPNNLPLWLPTCSADSTCEESPYLSGFVYSDVNLNHTYDSLIDFPLNDVHIINSNQWRTNTWSDGRYLLRLDSNTTNIFSLVIDNPNFVYPQQYVVNTTNVINNGTNYNFAVQLYPLDLSDNNKNPTNYFPNPTRDFLIVDFEDVEGEFRMVDLFGKEILHSKVMPNQTIDLSHVSSGIYIGHLNSKNNKVVFKINKL